LETQQRLKKRLRSALIYPAFVLSMALIIVSVLMIFVVPTFTSIFAEMGGELPALTKILIALSMFFKNYWYGIGGGMVLIVYGIR